MKSLKDMTSFGTDFETHAIWQGYVEDPTAKDFVARNARIIALSKAREAVIRQATINLIHKFGNPLGIPYPSYTV
jgi:hypothetical protein